jgi:hypothetical protein
MSLRPRLVPCIVLLLLLQLVVLVGSVTPAGAEVAPPWCGMPTPDAAGDLPDR